ncbi:MAG: hypothetical protein ABII12_10885 [Planctomycetota bacterium]
MRPTEKRPAATGIAERGSNYWRTDDTSTTGETQGRDRFPVCRLLGVRIVDFLPRRCPLRGDWPLVVIGRMTDIAFAELRLGPDGDLGGALDTLARCETCLSCFTRQNRHPRVRGLRPNGGGAA